MSEDRRLECPAEEFLNIGKSTVPTTMEKASFDSGYFMARKLVRAGWEGSER